MIPASIEIRACRLTPLILSEKLGLCVLDRVRRREFSGSGACVGGTIPVNGEDAPRLPRSYEGLRALQAEFARYQEEAFPVREPRFFALELAGETGELANLEKKEWKGREVESADYTDEAADVMIAVMNYANARGIDLGAAVSDKMARIERIRKEQPEK